MHICNVHGNMAARALAPDLKPSWTREPGFPRMIPSSSFARIPRTSMPARAGRHCEHSGWSASAAHKHPAGSDTVNDYKLIAASDYAVRRRRTPGNQACSVRRFSFRENGTSSSERGQKTRCSNHPARLCTLENKAYRESRTVCAWAGGRRTSDNQTVVIGAAARLPGVKHDPNPLQRRRLRARDSAGEWGGEGGARSPPTCCVRTQPRPGAHRSRAVAASSARRSGARLGCGTHVLVAGARCAVHVPGFQRAVEVPGGAEGPPPARDRRRVRMGASPQAVASRRAAVEHPPVWEGKAFAWLPPRSARSGKKKWTPPVRGATFLDSRHEGAGLIVRTERA